jgi:cytochrome c553
MKNTIDSIHPPSATRLPTVSSAARRWGPFGLTTLLGLALLGGSASAQDLGRGKEINATCAGCHGELGQGGKRGEYPRIGGQHAPYLAEQLKAFRARTRLNMPMFPYTQERELPDQDVADVAAYLASVELPTQWPVFKPSDDAMTRLAATEKVMIIPRAPGNVDNGARIYQDECALCHGKDGMGRRKFPRLVGQYSNYLLKQMTAYRLGERPHDEEGLTGALNPLQASDLQDILAYLTTLQTRGKP